MERKSAGEEEWLEVTSEKVYAAKSAGSSLGQEGPSLYLSPMLRLNLQQRLEQNLEMRLLQQQYMEDSYKEMEEIVPGAWENARKNGRIRRYQKNGLDFEYAVINKIDYEGHLSPFDMMSDTEEAVCGFAHYSESSRRFYLMVDGDFFKKSGAEEFIEYVAVHERGEELFSGHVSAGRSESPHFYATKLEFAIVGKDGKIRPYLAWIEKNWPGKLGDVYTIIEGGDSVLLDRISGSDEFREHVAALKQSKDYALANSMLEGFEFSAETMEKIYIFEKINQQAEAVLEAAIIRIANAVEKQEIAGNMTFTGFLTGLNGIMKEALDNVISEGYADKLYLRRVKLACREYLKKYLDVELQKRWQGYVKAKEAQRLDAFREIEDISKLEFIVNMGFDINRIMGYLKAQHKHSAKETLTAYEMLFKDAVIAEQKEYLESGRIEDLKYIAPDGIASEIGIEDTTVTRFMNKIKTFSYRGKEYPLKLLVPSTRFIYLQAEDMLKELLGKNNGDIEALSQGLSRRTKEGIGNYAKFKIELEKRAFKNGILPSGFLTVRISNRTINAYIGKFITEARKNSADSSLTKIEQVLKGHLNRIVSLDALAEEAGLPKDQLIGEINQINADKKHPLSVDPVGFGDVYIRKNPAVRNNEEASSGLAPKNDLSRGDGASSALSRKEGGIDLTKIELTLKDEKYVSSLSPADLKILRAAKALSQGRDSLAVLYIHEVMMLFKYNLIQNLNQRPLVLQILGRLQQEEALDEDAAHFFNLLQSNQPIAGLKLALQGKP